MGYCRVKADREGVLRYHILKLITEDSLSFLKRLLPNGQIVTGGVYHDREQRFRVFFEHSLNTGGNIGRWDRGDNSFSPFSESFGQDFGQDFISLYAKVEGTRRAGGMSEEQAIEELAKYYCIPWEIRDNQVAGWKQVEIENVNIYNNIFSVKGYYQLSPQEKELHNNAPNWSKVLNYPDEFPRSARYIYDRNGNLMGLMFIDSDGKPLLKTLWNKKPHSKKYEWHYSNFEKEPYPFDKTHLAFNAMNKTVYVIGDPALAEQFERWQKDGVPRLQGALVMTWYGGRETVVDLDWDAIKHNDLRVVIRETEEDLQLAQAIIEHVVERHVLKSVSFYRYGTETVHIGTLLYKFDSSRGFNLADGAFLFQLSTEDIYVGLGLEERVEALEYLPEEQGDSLVCIEGVLKREAATMLYAYDGVGKSMIALSVGMALAGGKNVFVRHWKVPSRRRVLYVDGENPKEDIERREKAFRRCYGLDESSQYYRMISASKERRRFDLTDEEFIDRLRGELFTPSGKRKVDVLILDNWSVLYSGDEDKAWRDINGFLADLKHAGLAILFVHHASDADPSKPDGFKKKNRFFDSRFYALKNENSSRNLYVRVHGAKNRSGEGHTDFDLWLSFVKNQSGEERAFWLVDPTPEALEIFELRAKGVSYEQMDEKDESGKKKYPYSKSTAQRKFREGVPNNIDLGKWVKSS